MCYSLADVSSPDRFQSEWCVRSGETESFSFPAWLIKWWAVRVWEWERSRKLVVFICKSGLSGWTPPFILQEETHLPSSFLRLCDSPPRCQSSPFLNDYLFHCLCSAFVACSKNSRVFLSERVALNLSGWSCECCTLEAVRADTNPGWDAVGWLGLKTAASLLERINLWLNSTQLNFTAQIKLEKMLFC